MKPDVSNWMLSVARALPRGGFPLVRMLCRANPNLKRYPIRLQRLNNYRMICDLSESAYFMPFKYGYFPDQLGEEAVIRRLVHRSSNVIDVGANIGYYSVLFASIATDGSVYSFEPSPKCISYLKNVARDFPNLRVVDLALSDREGVVGFKESRNLPLSHVREDIDADTVRVHATTLDRWTAREGVRVDFIKVDVEGHDLQVIRGGRQTIERDRPTVMFEAIANSQWKRIIDLFNEISVLYDIKRICHDGNIVDVNSESDVDERNLTYNYVSIPR